jgi:Tol biopolymer transport system component
MNAPAPESPSALRPKQLHRCIASAATIFLFAGIAVSAAAPTRGATAAAPSGTIVFASDRSGNYQIYSVHADGSRLGQLTRNHASDTAPRFSPDGRRIVFTRSTNCCGPALWVMNADGSRERRLVAYGSDPAWSPDSRRIAYAGFGKGAANAYPLVIAGVDGRRRIVIRGRNHHPAWSPDGKWIAFGREVKERTDLVVVGRDGGRLKTIRRNSGYNDPLTWSPHGEIVITTSRGICLVRADSRRTRCLVREAYGFALSPDGRQFAWIAGRGRRLKVRRVSGGRTRDITPKDAGNLDSPAWSADGRSIAMASLPGGAVYDDLLVAAANGTSSRRITHRVPYPYGRENQQPNWRPRGATPTRLGSRPVAPLPSETVSRSAFGAPGGGTITSIAADGDRVAMVIDFPYCASVEVWDAKRGQVSRLKRPCGPHSESGSSQEGTYGAALAGTRAAWIHTSGGNTLETYVDTATLARPRPVSLASGGADNGGAGTFAGAAFGDGGLLAFTLDKRCDSDGDLNGRPEDQCPPGKRTGDVVAASVWRVGGQGRCPEQTPPSGGCTRVAEAVGGDLTVLAVDAGRIAVRTDTSVRLLTEQGAVLRDFVVTARAAVLSGNRLAVRTATAVEIFDTGSGELLSRMPVAGGVTLDDLEGDLLVTGSRDTVTVRRLGDGRTTTFRRGGTARAQLEQPGLFVADTRRVTFTPMSELLRRLGA